MDIHHDLSKLSNRQKEILRLLADDLSIDAISRRLSLTSRTISGHQQSIIRQFGLEDEAALIQLAKSVYL
ncbi:LuxR C-terminal-related transcriptional regulator [Spirosoma utsteinense]|uniref:LuxR C-terminal-related transcriptional regulator n=1 Tax=Spirosoma utsteinense TaxID=2585773 RepID=UPI0016489DCE